MSDNLIIFGGTGDLSHRKLIPAIYNLYASKKIHEDFKIIAIGRRKITVDEYKKSLKEFLEKVSRTSLDINIWEKIEKNIYYLFFNFEEDDGYEGLKSLILNLGLKQVYYYLAVAPHYFDIIVEKLKLNDMHFYIDEKDNKIENKLAIEKPFGKNLASAIKLNKKILKVFDEKNIYRIDHYLGKEMIQNILALRFSNLLFEPLWNNKYIDNVQITSSETVGVETRGEYYEKSGALKDMFQNHMLQLVALTAMEPPVSLGADCIHDEKVKVFRSISKLTENIVMENVVRGQYIRNEKDKIKGYIEEDKVSNSSHVETFLSAKISIENYRWHDVPFYIRTGKRLKEKCIKIVVEFKKIPNLLYGKIHDSVTPNRLIISIQPTEGISFIFNGKETGINDNLKKIELEYKKDSVNMENTPEAYERLIYDFLIGDRTLFSRWDELEKAWRITDKIADCWSNEQPVLAKYEAGTTYGPEESDKLLKKDGRSWYNYENL